MSLGFWPLIGQERSALDRVLTCLQEVRFRFRVMFRFRAMFRIGVRFRVVFRVNPYPKHNPNPNQPEESPSSQSEARIPDSSYENTTHCSLSPQ